jgi:hypothetical protein
MISSLSVLAQITTENKTTYNKSLWVNGDYFDFPHGINLAYSNQIHSAIEIGYARYLKVISKKKLDRYELSAARGARYTFAYWNVGSSLDFLLSRNFILGLKLYSNFTYNYFSSQLNVTAYTDFKTICPIIKPEIGIGKFIGVRYGYNFKLNKNSFNAIGNHKITFFINWRPVFRNKNPVKFN